MGRKAKLERKKKLIRQLTLLREKLVSSRWSVNKDYLGKRQNKISGKSKINCMARMLINLSMSQCSNQSIGRLQADSAEWII